MIKTNPLSVKDIEKIANNFRKEYNVKENEFFPILDIIDEMFVKGMLSYQVVEEDYRLLDKDTPAVYNSYENFMYIKESVIEEYEKDIYRSCFTLCHELFHFIQTEVLNFDFEECDECKLYEDVDWQANEFAGQLLIPTKYIDLPENDLQEMFHVSLECVLTRKTKVKKRQKK